MRVRKKQVALTELQEPAFISLVGLPANRTGFKVVREDAAAATDEEKETADPAPMRKRKKKCGDKGLLSISLPLGVTQDEAVEILTKFDMEDDYEVAADDSGNLYLKRKDTELSAIDNTVSIPLADGMVANISQEVFVRSDIKAITGATLSRIDFDSIFGTREDVESWLKKNEIDCKNIEEVEGGFIATRAETSNIEKPVKISEGVRGYVFRSEKTDIPVRVYRSVMEQSYGNYGWGHLDFASALADPEFTEDSYDAIWILRDVLENIVIYSGLPLDERKVLVQNACDNFASYISAMMDSLPRGAVPVGQDASKQTSDTKNLENAMPDTKDKASNPEYVTRSDLEQIVADAVAKALAPASKPEETASADNAKRQDAGAEGETSDAAPAPAAATVTDPTLLKTIADLAESQKTIAASLSAMRGDIEALGNSTVARRSDDTNESTVDSTASKTKRGDVFSGVFGITL